MTPIGYNLSCIFSVGTETIAYMLTEGLSATARLVESHTFYHLLRFYCQSSYILH